MWAYVVVALLGAAVLYAGVPNLLIRVLRLGALWRGPRDPRQKVVALTFDDGPDAKYTPRVLDALREGGVRATFFVIAEKAERQPDIVRRMLAEGHDVQVHGYRHWMVPLLPPGLAVQQVARSAEVLGRLFGIRTRLYRPTWGLLNLATLLSRACRSHRLVIWSVMVGDWRVTPAQVLLGRILKRMHPGAMIVLHDSDDTWGAEAGAPEGVIEMLPELIAALRR
ncbi:MAG: polysaccharide deacetylase family protein, partial [Alicyclobacillus sp.]|nr:polysaccharide deacetylase family protein [Alicyclobacillus sp.]